MIPRAKVAITKKSKIVKKGKISTIEVDGVLFNLHIIAFSVSFIYFLSMIGKVLLRYWNDWCVSELFDRSQVYNYQIK